MKSKGSQSSLTLAAEELPLYNKDYYVPSRISWSVLDTGSQLVELLRSNWISQRKRTLT